MSPVRSSCCSGCEWDLFPLPAVITSVFNPGNGLPLPFDMDKEKRPRKDRQAAMAEGLGTTDLKHQNCIVLGY